MHFSAEDFPPADIPRRDFDLLDYTKEYAQWALTRLTEPESDIFPVLMMLGPYGLGIMPLEKMGDEGAKDELADIITVALAVARATEVVMVTTAWSVHVKLKDVKLKDGDVLLGMMPSEHPDRIEAVMLMHSGDGRPDTNTSGVLTRYPDRPPTMAEWETMTTSQSTGGRFGHAIHKGLGLASSMDEELIAIINSGWADGVEQEMMERFHKVFTDVSRDMQQ